MKIVIQGTYQPHAETEQLFEKVRLEISIEELERLPRSQAAMTAYTVAAIIDECNALCPCCKKR